MNIAGLEVGGSAPCRFVAEVSNNHNGDRDRCGRLIDAAKAAGADFVKFQCYTPDELVALRGDGPAPEPWGSQGWTMRTLYEKARTPLEWFPKIAEHCERVGIPWFSSVFGLESLKVLEDCGCPAYKIARLDNGDAGLRGAVRRMNKPVIISDNGTMRRPATLHVDYDFYLYCPSGYPTEPKDVQLPKFRSDTFGKKYDGTIGLSSHCLAPELPIAAVARGAKLLEYHFMLEAEPSELESNVSLTEKQFAAMVQNVRRTEAMLA
jgi:pseudaminic acid synthase